MFNEAQKLVLATYGGGDYAHLTTLDECRDVGDTLFTFLMLELDDKEDCTDMLEAARRVSAARDQLNEILVKLGAFVPRSEKLFDRSQVFSGMCIIEEMVDPVLGDASTPWQDWRDQNGIASLRDVAIDLIEPADAAWDKAQRAYETAYKAFQAGECTEPTDPGSFDYEFLPFWLREGVDWSDTRAGPRVRGSTTVSAP